jgi:hypothetical protein
MKLPSSLCLTLSTIRGRSSLNPRTASLIACASTSTTAPRTITIPSTSTVEHRPRLQPSRSSIAVTTGERTATPKMETKITSRMLPIDASAHAMATAPATSRIVRIEIETSISPRPVSVAPEEVSAAVIYGTRPPNGGHAVTALDISVRPLKRRALFRAGAGDGRMVTNGSRRGGIPSVSGNIARAYLLS